MSSLHRFTDVLPVSLADLTYDLSVGAHNWASVGSIRTLLGTSDVHLQRTINATNNTEWRNTHAIRVLINDKHVCML